MRTCLVVGCGQWTEEHEDICPGCQVGWVASGEYRRAKAMLPVKMLPIDGVSLNRVEVAIGDWLRRIEAERRNGGQP